MTRTDKYEITLIKGVAEAWGSTINDKATGTLVNWCTITFNGNKVITTSKGEANG
jgi:dTDP-4-amino-4,6-dideoxygalactose transaminase